ncbi:DNA replication/repair protein RecF [Tropicibacter naphthalenivorans]|uniref:DNA replication and repair protein RecF n=1 Tax=Tropicibacter naphthalenivorans TaxID=441103 RepID=A0A0P1GVQ2_9RHOB|nr:DNA replication/repair protein RecF [Tropicibacter naphthalenivorans]CUH79757.1 DNA replication and repair protein RecF [Tropicibacter naphthalenivorans]SMC74988.1 DNA replication and repair protein RecF [Tropicibacter naphthalenivorans]
MYLSRLTLSHFRSHLHAEVDVDARPVAIYGPNGAGKTNLIEAVSLFSPGRGLRRASAQEMARRPESLGWKITGVLHGGGQPHEIAFTSEQGAARQVQIDGKNASQVALGRLARAVWLVPSMDRLWIEGAEGRRRFLDRVTLSFYPEHAQAALDYEKAMRERNRLLKEQIRDAHWYKALELQMARSGAELDANRRAALSRLTEAQAGAETAFPIAELEMVQSEGSMPDGEADLLSALEESRFRDIAAGRTLVGPHRTDLYGVFKAKGVPASECSTGEQKALLISLILANARALAGDIGAVPILLLDEVAAHLDAGRRAALYDEICALGAQAWMTGTGPELFAELGSRAQGVEVSEAGELRRV